MNDGVFYVTLYLGGLAIGWIYGFIHGYGTRCRELRKAETSG